MHDLRRSQSTCPLGTVCLESLNNSNRDHPSHSETQKHIYYVCFIIISDDMVLLILKELPGFKVRDWGWSFQAPFYICLLSDLALHAITAQRYEVTNMAGRFPWQVEMMKEQPSDTGFDSTPKTKSIPRKTGACFDSQIQGFLWLGQTSFL